MPCRTSSAWLLTLVLMGCKHIPDERERQGAEDHYALALSDQSLGHTQEAYKNLQKSLELDPDYPEAHNAMGVLLHLAFNRPEEAVQHYKKALEVLPTFSEARTNLANVYLSQGRYDEAIKLYEEALNDMLYSKPYIAQGNLGWALYKKGERDKALRNIKAAVTLNPNFCQGYRNLGIIYEESGDISEACRQYTHYRTTCPEEVDAYMREGACQVKQGKLQDARQTFTTCEDKARTQVVKDECHKLLEAL